MSTLPLFPLGTVLLPDAQLPLRIFEPRYVQLLRDLTGNAGQPKTFGVIAIHRGVEVGSGQATQLYPVGCEAVLDSVARDAAAGQPVYRVLVHGGRRFELNALKPTGAPYLVGDVTWLRQDETRATDVSRQGPLALLSEYVALVRNGTANVDAAASGTAQELAYAVTAHLALDVADRQAVLAAADGPAALGRVRDLLNREIRLVGTLGALPATGVQSPPNPN